MKKQIKDLTKAISANIELINESKDYVIMHDYKLDMALLTPEEDIEGLQDLLVQTEADLTKIAENSPKT